MKFIKNLNGLLVSQERRQGFVLLVMTVLMALLEMIGISSIVPFVSVMAKPELLETNASYKSILTFARTFVDFTAEQALFASGIIVLTLLVISLAFKAATTYLQLHFVFMREYSIGKRLMEGYLRQPYSWFLSRNSADLGKTILSEVNQVVYHGLMPLINLVSHSAVAIALVTLLILTDPLLALTAGTTLASAYALIYWAFRGVLVDNGDDRIKANHERFTAISEAFGSPKEVKLAGLEEAYIKRFSLPAKAYAKSQVSAQLIGQLPRFALEAIAFGGMILLVLYLVSKRGDLANALPVISLYAFVGYRLMPALQNIYGAMTSLRYAGPGLDALHADMTSLQNISLDTERVVSPRFDRAIALKCAQYKYPNAPSPVIKNLSLIIPAKSIVGLVGATGSGKTTTVDLILGLLETQSGVLEVDGEAITASNVRAWQRGIGYVPQQIYLSDDTIAANIAYGLVGDGIDQEAVERAAKVANLHDFVISELPKRYQTVVGERGVRLSGGQRQRIGIARALYHNPTVLVLDEATSALDNITEQAVMDAVSNMKYEVTIIVIAHRLSTVKLCDRIFYLEKGQLRAEGTYEDLVKLSKQFRKMAIGQ